VERKTVTVFKSSYIFEQNFSLTKRNKSQVHVQRLNQDFERSCEQWNLKVYTTHHTKYSKCFQQPHTTTSVH